MKEGVQNNQEIFAPAHFPGEEDSVPPEEISQVLDYCSSKNLNFIVG